MALLQALARLLRKPLLIVSKVRLAPLAYGAPVFRRAAYDAMPVPYLVVGDRERFVVSTRDRVIGRQLFLHGQFDFDKLQIALRILKHEGLPSPNHLIDVGANIGTIVIPAIARGLFQTAVAIEPHPDNVRLLRTNCAPPKGLISREKAGKHGMKWDGTQERRGFRALGTS